MTKDNKAGQVVCPKCGMPTGGHNTAGHCLHTDGALCLKRQNAQKDAEIAALKLSVGEKDKALEPLAKLPTHGRHGGPLCAVTALYEDGSTPEHTTLGHEVIERAAAAYTGNGDLAKAAQAVVDAAVKRRRADVAMESKAIEIGPAPIMHPAVVVLYHGLHNCNTAENEAVDAYLQAQKERKG